MLDSYIRPIIDPPLNLVGRGLARMGFVANQITYFGFALGIFAMTLIALGFPTAGFVFLCFNRLCDGLDGAVARAQGTTDLGGFLDIVCDFLFYSGVVFAFALNNSSRALPAAFLIFSFIGPMVSFLAYAIITSKRGIETRAQGVKSFFYMEGLCEGTETIVFLSLMCIFPKAFNVLAILFGMMCWVTTWGRTQKALRDFQDDLVPLTLWTKA